MLKIDRHARTFARLETPTLSDAAISERYDLQEYICNSPDAFFSEIGQRLFVIGKEIVPSDDVQDRIDVLALDREGCAVIIELKRGNHKLQMLQAIAYAGMVSKWEPNDFVDPLGPEKTEALTDFLEVDAEEINRRQRIILVAESFDYALLVSAEWLCERYGIEIVCCRLALATDVATKSEYLVCSNVFPAPELAKQAAKRGKGSSGVTALKWSDWESALADVTNGAVVSFFKDQLPLGRECYLRKRILRYRLDGTRRWFVAARRKNAYVWQHGRFTDDEQFWKKGLSDPDDVQPVKGGACLRLWLTTPNDFAYFLNAATKQLGSVTWTNVTTSDDEELEDAGVGSSG